MEYAVDTVFVDPRTGIQVAQLMGYSLPEISASPGAYVPVELCWKPVYIDLNSIIESAWNWHQAHPNGYEG